MDPGTEYGIRQPEPVRSAIDVSQVAQRFSESSPLNRLAHIDGSPIFDTPLLGYANGADPLFSQYKQIIGAIHMTPAEALSLDGLPAPDPSRISVIAWVLPIVERTRRSNRRRSHSPSRRWAHTKQYGEAFNDALRDRLVRALQEAGYRAIAPARTKAFRVYSKGVVRPPASSWSERHVCYAAGLGTFGLSDGLITPAGIAMRCGSIVTDMMLEPTPRLCASHTAYCQFLASGACGRCMERCPAGAITPDGHDKARCAHYISTHLRELHTQYGVTALTCGLCQTKVPCEFQIPDGSALLAANT